MCWYNKQDKLHDFSALECGGNYTVFLGHLNMKTELVSSVFVHLEKVREVGPAG